MEIPDAFSKEALTLVPRVLGFCDRDPGSPTFGCCDRNFWNYRLTDTANARLQESGFLLALAYSLPFKNNVFYHQPMILEWSKAIWRFWLKGRNADGSVNEVYPFERSFCATSFTASAFVQTVLLTGRADVWSEELKTAQRTMHWLAKNPQSDTANQMAASLVALAGYALLTGESTFKRYAQDRREDVLRLADRDGVLNEYGGLDVGYQTITLGQLMRANQLCGGDARLEALLRQGINLLDPWIDSTGQVDVSKNSRNTQFIYPYIFAALRSPVVSKLENGLRQNVMLRPQWMDDRYCVALSIDYLMASEEFLKLGNP